MSRSCVGLACALLSLAGCSPGGEGAARSVLLITLDTTRADALSCYGGRPGVTPALDALARRAVLYESAYSVAPLTVPAHASMLTGLYPLRHTVRGNGSVPLPASAETLAERAHAAGYQTAAFVSSIVLDRVWGLDQGFDVYDQPASGAAVSMVHMLDRSAHDTLRRATNWFAARDRSRPFFVWVHFFDPHSPCEPPKRFLDQAGGVPYLGEVSVMDDAIGALLEDLRRAGAADSTLVCVVADHGEGLGEHGEYTHGVFCYEATMHIPFLIAHPDGWRAGERSSEIVSLVDVEPTLAEAMGFPAREAIDGRSLRHVQEDGRAVFLESFYGYMNFGWSPIVGLVDRAGKYLSSGRDELYRVRTDPLETRDESPVAAADEIARYRAAIAEIARRPALHSSAAAGVDEAARDRLQGLGYAGAPVSSLALPAPLEDTGRPLAVDRIEELNRYQYAVAAGAAGQIDEARAIFEEIARTNPLHGAALSQLGSIQLEQKRCAEAAATLARLEGLGAAEARMHGALSRCFEDEKNVPAALEHMKRARELKPDSALILDELARLFALAGQPKRAQLAQREADRLRQASAGSN